MRILAVTNLYPTPYHQTRATFNRQQFRALATEHPVRVIAPIAWTDEWAASRQGKPRVPRSREVMCDGIRVEHPRYYFTPKIFRGWYGHFYRQSLKRSFERAVGEFRPDVVLAPWAYPDGWAAVDLGNRAGLPVVIKVHGSDVLLADGPRRGRVAEAVRRAQGVLAVSQHLAERVIELGADPQRVRVVYDGVDTARFHPGNRAEAGARLNLTRELPIVLFVGNLVPVKGLDILIAAVGRLIQAGIRFNCFIVGQGPLRRQLELQAMSVGAGEFVKFVGPLAHELLPDWFRAADLFVLPSRSEGVPIVLLEATACGIPFVASRVGGIPEILHLGDGRLVSPGDAAELASAIRKALVDGAANGKQLDAATRRSHAAAAKDIVGFLGDVIRTHCRPAPCVGEACIA